MARIQRVLEKGFKNQFKKGTPEGFQEIRWEFETFKLKRNSFECFEIMQINLSLGKILQNYDLKDNQFEVNSRVIISR